MRQTYPVRELVLVTQSDDESTRSYLQDICGQLGNSLVHIQADASARLTLGSLRNLGVQAARGSYVAHWDDDDWHAPDRLERQLAAIRRSGKPACTLARLTLYDTVTHTAYITATRPWEGTLVAERAIMPVFPDLQRGEDTAIVAELRARSLVCLLDRPQSYVYVYHGQNTWDRQHWETNLLAHAQALSPQESDRVRSLFLADSDA